ncbi:MAG TPA: DEAD/DEAH box helicase family protein [Longimicrobiaceae bacterium]|nr:DEAD/DEAH box helicase family protein [Longimicrobiaceae bacterium]
MPSPDTAALEVLLAQLERAWEEQGDAQLVEALAAAHPGYADELYAFFDALVSEDDPLPDGVGAAAVRGTLAWLRDGGHEELADIARQESSGATPRLEISDEVGFGRRSYFKEHYLRLRYPVAEDGRLGLRRAQLGAIHAINSHFTLREEPAVVVMPTGSGKTAVLMMAAFGLRARRVLVVTPSVLVRNQIAESFASLSTLRRIGALDEECPDPAVTEVFGKLRNPEAWEMLQAYDVVVGTPNSVSPGAQGVAVPPADLFDLILVDEAHHNRAPTWDRLLSAFPGAKQVHFTATPFRRDRQAMHGDFVYTYPLSEAYRDGVFGAIRYVPVEPAGESSDIVIAKAAEQVFSQDQAAGLIHLVMVRTDSRQRADTLREVYASNTGLNLRIVHSGLSPKVVKRTIEQLRKSELDGVICVDMLGEGFDLPTLKIAAIHVPHRSLAVTLQFIGRFARTEAEEKIGEAKFVAVPSEIEIEREKLFEESATWQQIVTNLSEGRITEEVEMREQIATFTQSARPELDYRDVSLHALRPFNHLKIFQVNRPAEDIDMEADLDLPPPFEVVHRQTSEELSATVFITRAETSPRWTSLEAFSTVEHDLFVVYHHSESNLLFIHCSRSTASLYEHVAASFTGRVHRILPLTKVNRVLATLTDLEFYNIGMRRRALHANAESYRIGAGSAMQNAISRTDGVMYHRGHVVGAGVDSKGRRENIGYSSASKVWSSRHTLIPQLVGWARVLAWRIQNHRDVVTDSGLDYLDTGEEIHAFPDEGIIAVDWPRDVYMRPRRLKHLDTGAEVPILDVDLGIDVDATRNGCIRLTLAGRGVNLALEYSLTSDGARFALVENPPEEYVVIVGRDDLTLPDYFQEHPPRVFLADFSVIDGGQLFRTPPVLAPFDPSRVEAIQWTVLGVNIRKEFYEEGDKRDGHSIHDYLAAYLPAQDEEVVFYDHGTGEMADFVTFTRSPAGVVIRFYHCKASHGEIPGSRVADAYEVASQVVKSVIWLRGAARILSQVNRREREVEGSCFLKGDRSLLKEVLNESRNAGLRYEMVLVQPGISRLKMKDNVATVLAAADRFIINHNCEGLRIWGSE